MFNETWEHSPEKGEETWGQFADRIKPTDGEIFKDVIGEEWVYETQDHCFRLISDGSRAELTSAMIDHVQCLLIDPIAEEKKNE